MASIERIHGRWRARFRTPEGESRSRTFNRKVDAERFLIGMEHAKLDASFADPKLGRRTFGSWWTTWRATRVDLRPSTIARDDSYYRTHIEPRFAERPLATIDRSMLREWVAEMNAKGLAPATVVKAVQLVSKALDAAVDERIIARNVAERLPLPEVVAHEMRFLRPDEIARLGDAIDPRFATWATTAAYSGLRFGELAGLRRRRLDLVRGRIDVAEIATEVRGQVFTGPPKTRAGRRSVPIPRSVVRRLVEHTAGMGADDLVFAAPEGGYLRASAFRRRFWRPAIESADLAPLRPHDLRHTAVSLWLAGGSDPKEIATWAGHASVATVLDRYGHLMPEREGRVMDALDAMFDAGSAAPNGAEVRPFRRAE